MREVRIKQATFRLLDGHSDHKAMLCTSMVAAIYKVQFKDINMSWGSFKFSTSTFHSESMLTSKVYLRRTFLFQGLMGEAGLIPVLLPNTGGRSRCVYLTLGERLLPNGYRGAQMDVFNETGLNQRKLFS